MSWSYGQNIVNSGLFPTGNEETSFQSAPERLKSVGVILYASVSSDIGMYVKFTPKGGIPTSAKDSDLGTFLPTGIPITLRKMDPADMRRLFDATYSVQSAIKLWIYMWDDSDEHQG